MPFVNADWKDEVIPIVDDSNVAVSTTGWSGELHIRKKPGATPAVLKLKTSDGTLLVGQATSTGTDNGIAPFVGAAAMSFAPGTYDWDFKRTDGGRDEWVIGGDGVFEKPVTITSLA